MLTLAKMQKILFEEDIEKQRSMVDALPEYEKQALLKEAERIHQTAEFLVKKPADPEWHEFFLKVTQGRPDKK